MTGEILYKTCIPVIEQLFLSVPYVLAWLMIFLVFALVFAIIFYLFYSSFKK